MLISLSGVPGTGKTTLARELARTIGAVHLSIDAIERVLARSLAAGQSSYRVAYSVAHALADENLRLGRAVIADCVNPIAQSRDEWLAVAKAAGARAIEIEVICSDAAELDRRLMPAGPRDDTITARSIEVTRHYAAWDRPHHVIDTAGRTVEESLALLMRTVQ